MAPVSPAPVSAALSGSLPSQENGFGTASLPRSGIQNGASDGLALVDSGGTVQQFLSYEGAFTATDGAAMGMTSADIGVSEPSSNPVGFSLQLTGAGTECEDFTWASAMQNTFGAVNSGQIFVPEPATGFLLLLGLTGFAVYGRRRAS